MILPEVFRIVAFASQSEVVADPTTSRSSRTNPPVPSSLIASALINTETRESLSRVIAARVGDPEASPLIVISPVVESASSEAFSSAGQPIEKISLAPDVEATEIERSKSTLLMMSIKSLEVGTAATAIEEPISLLNTSTAIEMFSIVSDLGKNVSVESVRS